MKGLECLKRIDTKNYLTEREHRDFYSVVEKSLKALEVIKPLCEVVETPVKKYRYLKVNGAVVYTFKNEEEFNLLKECLE